MRRWDQDSDDELPDLADREGSNWRSDADQAGRSGRKASRPRRMGAPLHTLQDAYDTLLERAEAQLQVAVYDDDGSLRSF